MSGITTLDYVNALGYISFADDVYPLLATGDKAGVTESINIHTGKSSGANSGSMGIYSGDAPAGVSGSLYLYTGAAPVGGQISINAKGTTPGPITLAQNGTARVTVSNVGGVAINTAAAQAFTLRQNGSDRIICDVNGALGLDPDPSQQVFLNSTGSNGLVLNNTAIANYAPSSLNVYESASVNLTFAGAFSPSVTVPAKLTRLGNLVTITVGPTGMHTASNNTLVAAASIPARFRSGSNAYDGWAPIRDNGAVANGYLTVNSSGDFVVAPNGNAFTAAANAGWNSNISISYTLM